MIRGFFILCVFILGIAACATTFEPTPVDVSTGRFPTGSVIDKEGIKVEKPFLQKYENMLYVKTDEKAEKYNDFFLKSFSSIKPYKTVLDKPKLEALVIERKLSDRVSGISDMVALNRLSQEIGPFLVVEPTLGYEGGYNFSATLKVTDVTTGAVVLELRNSATNWSGLDQPLFFPLFNAFADWSSGQPIRFQPPTDQAESN